MSDNEYEFIIGLLSNHVEQQTFYNNVNDFQKTLLSNLKERWITLKYFRSHYSQYSYSPEYNRYSTSSPIDTKVRNLNN